MHAFGLEECNQYADAESAGRRALELEPRDGWAVHAVTHVMEMTGRIDDGIAWLEGRCDDWAPENGFAFHNFWHLALYRLDRQQYDAALALYDANIYAKPLDICVVLVDATSLLWRLNLEGVPLGARPAALADVWRRRSSEERGYYAFNDVHAAMAFCLANERDQARDLIAHLERVAPEIRSSNGEMTRQVGLPLAKAMLAFADGDYARRDRTRVTGPRSRSYVRRQPRAARRDHADADRSGFAVEPAQSRAASHCRTHDAEAGQRVGMAVAGARELNAPSGDGVEHPLNVVVLLELVDQFERLGGVLFR